MKKRFYVIVASVIFIATAVIVINSFNANSNSAVDEKKTPSTLFLYNQAKDLERNNEYLKAKRLYKNIIESSLDDGIAKDAQHSLASINMKILFSPLMTDESLLYEVKKGDTLIGIAKRFNTTVDLIAKSNNLQSDIIRIGQRLKVSKAKYSLVVDYSQNILALKQNEDVLKTYKISAGINNSTPIGTFKIINKLKDPVWYKAGAVVPSGSPENILGSRWMGLSVSGYGIHGTTEPETIGKHITAGCVRMKEEDVRELYSIVPVGTEVTIVN